MRHQVQFVQTEIAARWAAIVEMATDAIFAFDVDGLILEWNKGAEQLYGWSRSEVLGACVHTLLQTQGTRTLSEITQHVFAHGEWHGDLSHITRTGQNVVVASRWTPQYDDARGIRGMFQIDRDITRQQRAESALLQAEKLAVVGRMAASITHEIRAPLHAITSLLYLVESTGSVDDASKRHLRLIAEEVGRVTKIVNNTLGFYRESQDPVTVRLTEVLDSVLDLYARDVACHQVSVRKRYDTEGQVVSYPGELRQVFANLIRNAIDAVGQRGTIVLHVCESTDWVSGRKGVRVIIVDDGSGIELANLRRLFQPFFTTKGQKGTGLGLWITKGIVDKNGGRIHVRARAGKQHGTGVSVFIPSSRCEDLQLNLDVAA